ncbi:MAG: hypothetical protein ACOYXC_04525 [Candidatus Rifleibacteriota bacterium]
MTAAINLGALVYSLVLLYGGYVMFNRNPDKMKIFLICTNACFGILMICCCMLNLRCYELLQMAVTVNGSLAVYTLLLSLAINVLRTSAIFEPQD